MAKETEEIKQIVTSSGEGDNKVEKRMSVEEIENGYVVTETKQYTTKKGELKFDSKKYFSEKNPLTINSKTIATIKKNLPGS